MVVCASPRALPGTFWLNPAENTHRRAHDWRLHTRLSHTCPPLTRRASKPTSRAAATRLFAVACACPRPRAQPPRRHTHSLIQRNLASTSRCGHGGGGPGSHEAKGQTRALRCHCALWPSGSPDASSRRCSGRHGSRTEMCAPSALVSSPAVTIYVLQPAEDHRAPRAHAARTRRARARASVRRLTAARALHFAPLARRPRCPRHRRCQRARHPGRARARGASRSPSRGSRRLGRCRG